MSVTKSKVRFTHDEIKQRNAAREILARDESAFPDPTTAQWHRGRANGVLKRTYIQAKARAEERDKQAPRVPHGLEHLVENGRVPNGRTPEDWRAGRQRIANFFEAVAEGRAHFGARIEPVKPELTVKPIPVKPAMDTFGVPIAP